MTIRARSSIALLATVLSTTAVANNRMPAYSIQEIAVPEESECAPEAVREIRARRLNEHSELVGFTTCYVETGNPEAPYSGRGMRGFAWSPSTGAQFLRPYGALSSANDSFARDINEAGAIVGWEQSDLGLEPIAWRFGSETPEAAFAKSDCSSTSYARAQGINDSGGIIGVDNGTDPDTGRCRGTWAFVSGEGAKTLGPRGTAYALNNGPVGVGIAYEGSIQNAIKWSPSSGEVTVLATSNFNSGDSYLSVVPIFINDRGDAVASWSAGTDESGCVLDVLPMYFRADGEPIFLPTISKFPHGHATGINELRQVVGTAYAYSDPTDSQPCGSNWNSTAVMWKDAHVYDLNAVTPGRKGITLSEAFSINNAGQIVAYGTVETDANRICPNYPFDPITSSQIYVEGSCKPTRSFLLSPTTAPQLLELPDQTGDDTSDLALMRPGLTTAESRDGVTGILLQNETFLGPSYTALAAVSMPDVDGDGRSELAVLATRDSDGRALVEVRNVGGSGAIRSFWLSPGITPIGIATVKDHSASGEAPELAVLAIRDSDGRGLVEVRSAFGANPRSIWIGAGLSPLDLLVLPDADGNGVLEVAVLASRNSDGRIVVEIKNTAGATNPNSVWFMAGNTSIDLALVPDKDGNGIPEIAVLSKRNSDDRLVAEVKNVRGPTNPSTVWFSAGQVGVAMKGLGDADGNAVPDIAVLSRRGSDGRILVEVKNAIGATNPRSLWYPSGYTAWDLAILDDVDGNDIEEAGVLMSRDSDGRMLVQTRNAAGIQSPKDYWFSP